MTRKTKTDWLIEAFRVLTDKGFGGLTIDELTTRLGVTKGSFYHHFRDYEGFKIALLDFYEQEGTLQIIRLAEESVSPQAKLQRLFDIVTREDLPLEVPIRVWAHSDGLVREYQARVDARRVDYIRGLCQQIGRDEGRALFIAQLVYAVLIGGEDMIPPLPPSALRQMFDEISEHYQLK